MNTQLTQQEQDVLLQAMKTTCKLWIKLEKNDKGTLNLLMFNGYSKDEANTMLDMGKRYYDIFGKVEFKDLEVAA
jgi:hypothetical protein